MSNDGDEFEDLLAKQEEVLAEVPSFRVGNLTQRDELYERTPSEASETEVAQRKHEATEDQELRVLTQFRKCHSAFPDGEILRASPPAPDFIVSKGSRRIGIEITQSFWDTRDRGSVSKEKQAHWDRVLVAAEQEWKRRGNGPLSLSVMWNALRHSPPVQRTAIASLAHQIVDTLEHFRPKGQKPRLVKRRDPDGSMLPDEVLSLLIDLEAGEWVSGWVNPIPRLQRKHLQAEVDRKEAKLAMYREHCDEAWLLVWADWSVPGTSYATPPRLAPADFRLATTFDKVFFLDMSSCFEMGVDRSLLGLE